jgi:diphthine synthase
MAELWFVGAGLGDERDLSQNALDRLRSADRVFAEQYTSLLAPGSLGRLEAELGRPVQELNRTDVEDESVVLEALGRGERVALLVVGDPFVATTHVHLRLAAEAAGHRWEYVPGASVLTAATSFLGLMHYRFGRVVSLPFSDPGFEPVSPFEAIGRNRSAGSHTLLLLDLRPREGRFLTAADALARFEGPAAGAARVDLTTEFGVVARVGRPDAQAWWGTRAALAEVEFGAPLHTVVVPAPDLHFAETDAVRRWRPAGSAKPT